MSVEFTDFAVEFLLLRDHKVFKVMLSGNLELAISNPSVSFFKPPVISHNSQLLMAGFVSGNVRV